jgi:predicted nucleotidyltransferase
MNEAYLIQKLGNYDPNIKERILNVYQWGSRVYGTENHDSDWDFLVVVTKA